MVQEIGFFDVKFISAAVLMGNLLSGTNLITNIHQLKNHNFKEYVEKPSY